MADKVEVLKQKVAKLKEAVKKAKPEESRKLRKDLKRAQRKLHRLTPWTVEDKGKQTQTVLTMVSALLQDMQKNTKKHPTDPELRSLKKKVKSLNKKAKRIKKVVEANMPEPAPSQLPVDVAPAAAPAQPVAQAAPAEVKPSEAAPAVAEEKKS